MDSFRRVLGYVKPQYKAVSLSIFCALMGAMLFSLSFVAMLPLMKVLINEEGLHGWVNRGIVRHRSGINFEPLSVPDDFSKLTEAQVSHAEKLEIKSVKLKSAAYEAGLRERDEIQSVTAGSHSISDRDQILRKLVEIPGGEAVALAVERSDGTAETIELRLEKPPLYTGLAQKLLRFIPQDQGTDFKRKSIILIIVILLSATLIRCVMRFGQEYLANRIGFRTIMWLRRDAYRNAIRLPMSYFGTRGISDTMSRFVQDSNRINSGINTVLGKMIREPIAILFLVIAAFAINAKMTLLVLVGVLPAAVIIGMLGKKMRKATKRTLSSWSFMLANLQDRLLGIRVVKGYHCENHEEQHFGQINAKLLKQQFRVAKIDAASGPMLEALGMTAASVGMIFAARVMTGGHMETSEFFALVALLATIAESGRKLGDLWPRLSIANAAAERIFELIDTPAETNPPDAVELGRLSRNVEFRNLTFTYPNSEVPALQKIQAVVNAGETIAVVGPNGSGKTTLLSLIPKFYNPQEGTILIDGQDIARASLSSLREQIGIVTQNTIIFHDTIAYNIGYGRPEASREEIVAAARRAYAHEFIEQLAHQYDTIVGEQGSTLSGGQLQRLAIARAILRDPAILIFDEAMSQIDSESEAKIQKAIMEFSQGRTTFIIAHRLSTIIRSDRILVLDKGHLVAEGTHQTLLEKCTLYRKLYEVQFAC